MFVVKIENNRLLGIRIIEEGEPLNEGEQICSCEIDEKTSEAKLTLPDGITRIENRAMAGCNNVEYIELPNSLTKIGNEAFRGCSGIRKLVIPDSVTSIGNKAFEGCIGLTEVSMPNKKMKYFGDEVFLGCELISRVNLPGGTLCRENNESVNESYTYSEQDEIQLYRATAQKLYEQILYQGVRKEDVKEFLTTIITNEIRKMGWNCNIISGCDGYNYQSIWKISSIVSLDESSRVTNVFFFGDHKNVIAFVKTGTYTSEADSMYVNINRVLRLMKVQNAIEGPWGAVYIVAVVVFHEMEHIRQGHKLNCGISSFKGMQYCRERVLLELRARYGITNIYKKYHNSFIIETEANMHATTILNSLDMLPNLKFFRILRDDNLGGGIKRTIVWKNKRILFEDFVANIFDFIADKYWDVLMKTTPNIIKMIKKEYNEDGTKKRPEELIRCLNDEIEEYKELGDEVSNEELETLIKDCKALYFETLYRRMQEPECSRESIQKIGEIYDSNNRYRLFEEMRDYFITKISQMEDERNYFFDNRI